MGWDLKMMDRCRVLRHAVRPPALAAVGVGGVATNG